MQNKKRLHFGVIFSTMDNTNQYDIWNGIVEYAHKNDIHLTAYFGSYQMTVNDFASHFETCFETIKNSYSLDGVIIFSGFIVHMIGNENFEKYAAKISNKLPLVSISYFLPGAPSIIADNVAGTYNAAEHLIRVHGKKKIAFVKGPNGHPEAEDRLEGYKRALAENGIPYDERYIFHGNFDQDSGRNAVIKLLEMPELSADAIMASNDVSARGVLNELKNNNLSAPFDFAVTGFDDDKFSAAFRPPISTAQQDFYKFGVIAAETLFNQITGKPVEKINHVPPVFVERQSCGCSAGEISDVRPSYEEDRKEREFREIALRDNRWKVRRIAGNLVLIFDIDSLGEELYKSLPEISIDAAVIGLYKSPIKSGAPEADRTIDTLIGFDRDKKFNIKNNNGSPILFSDYSTVEGFDFDSERRDLFFFPLFFKDEEFGVMLLPYDADISVDTYETLRVNISTAIKGAQLINEIKHQNELLNEASKAKSNFLSSMSHEMRTPMNAIIGMTTIGKKSKEPEEKDKALEKIEDASSYLLGVINDILDMTKIEANKLELSPVEFNFDRMLQKVVTVVNFRVEEKNQEFTVFIDEKIPKFVVGDEQRLSQVVTNLMSNAVKFTPEGGKIRLEAFLSSEDDNECELCISVADNGIGISQKQQEKLFQAFEQAESGTSRKYGGTGLGLVISKNIIELMGGRIWIESEIGKGSKFIFTIKLARSEKNPRSLLSDNINWENVRVMAVDNEAETRDLFLNIFKELGICCDVASDGLEACSLIEERGEHDIYFIDWVMPNMDGIELTKKIKSSSRSEPVVAVMMTALEWEQIKDKALAAGADKCLTKPLFTSMIIDCINECLGKLCTADKKEEYIKGEFAGKRLLLAEDMEINREILMTLLEDTGISIDCAENGEEALAMVASSGGAYDIVFMDVQMPKMDGYEATRAIRALPNLRGSRLPIIAMTANVFKSDIEESVAAGMDEHLRKPIDFDRVLSVLRKYL